MAWWGSKDAKDDGPPELRDLTPEQIAAAVRESQQLRTDLAAQKTENETIKTRLASLEANPNNRPAPVVEDKNRIVSFLEDEDLAFQQRSAPIVAAVYTMGATAAKSQFENSLTGIDKAMFAKYGPEVETRMSAVDAPTKANPGAWKQAWNMVKGEHTEEITKAAQDRSDFFAETSSGSPIGGPGRTILPDDRLTEDELKTAKKYGIPEADFLAQRKTMQVYHD